MFPRTIMKKDINWQTISLKNKGFIMYFRKLVCFLIIVTMLFSATVIGFAAEEGPNIVADSAIIYCADTDEVIWEKNPHNKM